jgi:hypothetical protein
MEMTTQAVKTRINVGKMHLPLMIAMIEVAQFSHLVYLVLKVTDSPLF